MNAMHIETAGNSGYTWTIGNPLVTEAELDSGGASVGCCIPSGKHLVVCFVTQVSLF